MTTNAGEPNRQPAKRVLLVEDNPAFRRLLEVWLRSLGYEVTSASTAKDAIEVSNDLEGSYDLLLTDVGLPDLDGWTLQRELASSGKVTRHLFMSAVSLSLHQSRGRAIDSQLFLSKPFTRELLATKLDELESQ